jgi:hypothetical protein
MGRPYFWAFPYPRLAFMQLHYLVFRADSEHHLQAFFHPHVFLRQDLGELARRFVA